MYKTFTMELAGRTLKVDVGRVAAQANGAAFMQYGETTVLSTATASEKPREGIDFFRLSVEYQVKLDALALWARGGGEAVKEYDLSHAAAELGMVCGGRVKVRLQRRQQRKRGPPGVCPAAFAHLGNFCAAQKFSPLF